MLRPSDAAVAFRLLFHPGDKYETAASVLSLGAGSVHRSVRRLEDAGLLVPGRRMVNRHAFYRFLAFGGPHAFYASIGEESVRGVPTATAAIEFAGHFRPGPPMVWPSPSGTTYGLPVEPVLEGATELPGADPEVYRALVLFDVLRVGSPPNREVAARMLRAFVIGRSEADAMSPTASDPV